MKTWTLTFLMLLTMFLAACTPRIYGVPEDHWQTMSEQERIAAMEAYKANQETLRQQRQERARLREMEKQAQLARQAEEDRLRQLRVDAIYRGKGLYGDLLRVSLEGGTLRFHGVRRPFQPLSFKIAAEEMKDVAVVSLDGRTARMMVQYDGSNLLLDETPNSHRSTAIRLPFEDSWEFGATYPNLVSQGPLQFRGIDATVRIVGKPPRDRHGRRHMAHGTLQPPVVVVIEKPKVIVLDRHPGRVSRQRSGLPGSRLGKVVTALPARIEVAFRKGRFLVRKRSYPLVPVTIQLAHGQHRDIVMRGRNGNLLVRVRYSGGQVLIDEMPGRDSGPTRLDFVPGWHHGQPYLLKNSDSGLLQNVDMIVTAK